MKKALSQKVKDIHKKAVDVVKRYKSCEVELMEILQQADQFKVHYALGYSSLFKYATDGLGLSSEVSYIFINVARKAKQVPALKQEIKKGQISVSKAKRITPVLNEENQNHWLSLAKNASKRELEKQVASVSPRSAVRDKMDYVNESKEVKEKAQIQMLPPAAEEGKKGLAEPSGKVRVQLQVGLSEKVMLKLRRAQEILSQRKKSHASLEEVLEVMADLYIEKNDPVKRAERQEIRGKLHREGASRTGRQLGPGPVYKGSASSANRPAMPAALRHQLYLKYQGRCAHVDERGKRCEQRRHLKIHHLQPVSEGGGNELVNLTLICSGHHRGYHYHDGLRVKAASRQSDLFAQ